MWELSCLVVEMFADEERCCRSLYAIEWCIGEHVAGSRGGLILPGGTEEKPK
jgi:hypothetical protein